MNITSIVGYRILVRCLYNLVLKTFTVRNVSSVYSCSKMHSSAAMLKWIGSYLALNVFGRKMHDKKWCEIWCKYKIANSTHLHTYHITWAMYSIDIIWKKTPEQPIIALESITWQICPIHVFLRGKRESRGKMVREITLNNIPQYLWSVHNIH